MEAKNEYKKPVEVGQDIYDLCTQEYGSLNALFLLLADNPSLDLKRKLIPGELVKFRIEVPSEIKLNKNLADYYRTNTIRVNNKEVELLEDDCPLISSTGSTIVTANDKDVVVSSCNKQPIQEIPLSGILANGSVLVTQSSQLIIPKEIPSIGNNLGFSILTALGQEIQTEPPVLIYIFTSDEQFIETAQGDLLIQY